LLCDAGGESSSLYATDATRTVPIGGKFTQKQREIYNIVVEANLKAIDLIKPGVPYRDIHIESAKVIFNGLKNLGLCKGDTEAAVSEGVHALFYPHGLGHMLGLDVHDMEDMNETLVGYDDEIQRSTQFGLSGLRLGRRLQENFVITVEPGIYFIPALIDIWEKENKFSDYLNYEKINQYRDFGGIRIEDDILVTKDGSRVLGKPIPKTAEEVEEFMQNN
jgi:Xaa-Pro aminopeptidase